MSQNQKHTEVLKHLGIKRNPILIDMDGLTNWHATVKEYYNHNFYRPNWMDLGLNYTEDSQNFEKMFRPFMGVSNETNPKLILRNMQDWMTISRHYEMTMLDSKVCTWAIDHIGSISLCMMVMPLYWYSWLANYAWMLNEGLYLYHCLQRVYIGIGSFDFLTYQFLGYVVPLLIVTPLAYFTSLDSNDKIERLTTGYHNGTLTYQELEAKSLKYQCWDQNVDENYLTHVFITFPITCALVINLIIMINVLRILALKREQSKETKKGLKNRASRNYSIEGFDRNGSEAGMFSRKSSDISITGLRWTLLVVKCKKGKIF